MDDIKKQDHLEVEVEDLNGGGSTELITKPFNPNEIDVDISTVNLGSLIEQLENENKRETDFDENEFQNESDISSMYSTIKKTIISQDEQIMQILTSLFALAEGKKGGQFYTPRSVVELLVNMLEPYKGRVLDPCCGSGGMFVQSEKFVGLKHS